MQVETIKQLLNSQFPNAIINIESGDNVHFTATIVSDLFQGKNRVQQQQLVYAVLGEHIRSGAIHALALKTYTPEEYQGPEKN